MITHMLFALASLYIFASNTYAAPAFWDSLVGCYSTIEWNGQNIPSNNIENRSEIFIGDSMLVSELDNSPIPSYEMLLFQRKTTDSSFFSYASPFLNKGTYSQQNDMQIFNFAGELQYRFQAGIKIHVQHTVEAKRLANNNVWIHNIIHVDEADQFNTNEIFVLTPVTCN